MKRTQRLLFAALAFLCLFGLGRTVQAQTTTITASHERILGFDIPQGTVTFVGVNNAGIAITYADATGAQNGSSGAFSQASPVGIQCHLTAGAIDGAIGNDGSVSGTCKVPDAAQTTPANLLYTAIVCDTSTGKRTSGKCFTMQAVPGISGSSWALDHYAPPASTTVVQNIVAAHGSTVPTSCVSPTFFTKDTDHSVYTCVGGVFVAISGPQGAQGPVANFRGAWSSSSTYAIGDAVSYTDGSSYVSLTASNLNHIPNSDTVDWAVLAAHGATGPAGVDGTASIAVLNAAARNPNLVGPEVMTYGAYLNYDGVTPVDRSIASDQYSSCIPIAPNTTYTIGFPNVPWIPVQPSYVIPNSVGTLFFIFDGSNNLIQSGIPGANAGTGIVVLPSGGIPNPYTFTTPATAACIKFNGSNLTYSQSGQWVSGNAWTPDRVSTNNNSTSVMMLRGSTLPNYYLPFGKAALDYSATFLGKHIGIDGDSIASLFGVGWEQVLWSRLNPVKQVQEARSGRDFQHAFECFQTITPGSTPGTYDAGVAVGSTSGCAQGGYLESGQYGGYNWGGEATGQTLAQVVAPVDVMIVALGTNNTSTTLGALGDATNANTVYGDVRWVGETLHTANPSMTVLWVTPMQRFDGPSCTATSTWAQQNAVANAIEAYANSVGDPVINMTKVAGVTAITCAAKTRDGIHPSDAGFLNYYGPLIVEKLRSIM